MRQYRILALALMPACAPAQTAPAPNLARADTAAIHRTPDSLAAAHRGVVGYTVHNIDTGERLERRRAETFSTDSLIKVSFLLTLYDLIEKGDSALHDRIVTVE